MNNKTIAVATIAIGASALGGVMLLMNDREKTESQKPTESDRLAQASYFDDNLLSGQREVEEVERDEIDTRGNTGSGGNTERGWGAMFDRMHEFDSDGDGILSRDERREMMRQMREEWMARFDLDGDGELSREERNAMRQAMFEQSDRGQDLMRQFDTDGNGVLDEDEQAAMEAYQQQQREERRAQQLERYDTDGDGNLSRDERQAQREEQRSRWGDRMDDARMEFDRDGDGVLSIEESQEAFAVFQERRAIDEFLRGFDADGNGSMGPADYSAFLANYERGDMSADVNGDGELNAQDLTAYTDMVTRSRNRP